MARALTEILLYSCMAAFVTDCLARGRDLHQLGEGEANGSRVSGLQ